LFGEVRVQRAYFHCRACRGGEAPWDRRLGLSARFLTPAVAQLTALAGALTSFAQASQRTLRTMTGLRISESTVERTTEEAGARVGQLLEERVAFGAEQVWAWQHDAQGRTCAYVSWDATGVRQQGPGGAPAEGRMAYTAMIYNPDSPHDQRVRDEHQVRYLAGFYELDELGLELRRQAAQVGWDQAQQQIALTDGGAGLEQFLRRNFPRAIRILDFWHAQEHLVELSQTLFAEDAEARQAWLSEQRHRLKHAGGGAVLKCLEALALQGASAAAREAHAAHTGYFRNHQSRMDYPHYRAQGWQIGSGPVESACKTVVGNRLKGGGMRWGEDGADAICHLRALYLSEPTQWEAFWKEHPN
jgi:hypothetical protein